MQGLALSPWAVKALQFLTNIRLIPGYEGLGAAGMW